MTKYAITAISALVLGAVIGYKLSPHDSPQKVQTKDVEVSKTDVVTKTVTVQQPNGITETTTVVIDKTVKVKDKVVEVAKPEPKYYVRGAYGLLESGSYDIGAGSRVLGNLFVDVGLSSNRSFNDKQVKVGLTYLF